MGTVELWVPIRGTGTREDPFGPDLDVPHVVEQGIPADLDPNSPSHGRPATRYALVRVRDTDREHIRSAVPAAEVPEQDKLLVELCRCRTRGGPMTPEEESRVGAMLDRERARAERPEGKRLLGRLLRHGVARGMSEGTAAIIAAALDLETADSVLRDDLRRLARAAGRLS